MVGLEQEYVVSNGSPVDFRRLIHGLGLRRPHLDPICYLQVVLLDRLRSSAEPEPLLRRALLLTVNGIA